MNGKRDLREYLRCSCCFSDTEIEDFVNGREENREKIIHCHKEMKTQHTPEMAAEFRKRIEDFWAVVERAGSDLDYDKAKYEALVEKYGPVDFIKVWLLPSELEKAQLYAQSHNMTVEEAFKSAFFEKIRD